MKKLWFMFLRKYLRILLITLLVLLALLTLSLYIISVRYGPELKARAVKEVNAYLAVPIEINEISLSIWAHFPRIALQLKGVESREEMVYESQPRSIIAKEIALIFHPIELLQKKYRLRSIDLAEGELNLIVFWNGNDNYHFFKPDAQGGDGNIDLSFDAIRIRNFTLVYRDLQSDQKHQFFLESALVRGTLEGDIFSAKAEAEIQIQEISIGETTYLRDVFADVRSKLKVDIEAGSVEWEEATLAVGDITLEGKGSIVPEMEYVWLGMTFSASKVRMEEAIPLLPSSVQEELQSYAPSGQLGMKINIEGQSGDEHLPQILAEWSISRGSFRVCQDEKGLLQEVEASGTYDSGKEKGYAGQELRVTTMRAMFNQLPLRGNFHIQHFAPLLAYGEIAGQFRYTHLPDCWISSLDLNADAEIAFQGSFKYDESRVHPDHWSKAWELDLSGQLSQGSFRDDALGLDLHGLSAAFELKPAQLNIPAFSGKLNEGEISGRVSIADILGYLDLSAKKLKIDADVRAESLPLAHWMEMEGAVDEERAIWPEDLEAKIGIQIDKLAYREFRAEKISGQLHLADGNLQTDNLLLNAMGGQLKLDGMLRADPGAYRMQARAKLQGIQISELFRQMEDFGQNDLTHKQLSGVLDASIAFSMDLDQYLTPKPASISALSDISIRQGIIQDYPPLKELPRFIKAGNLDKVHIEPLRNQITIADQKVIIPEMAVNTDAMDLWISGTHSFDQQINYSLRVLLSEVLGRKATEARATASEFGWIEDDGLGRTSLFIRISGTADEPVFAYDRKEVLKKIGQDLKEDRKVVGKILREEFQWLRRDSLKRKEKEEARERLKKQESGEFILEWDPDSL